MSQWYYKILDFWCPCDSRTAAVWASRHGPVILADPGGVYVYKKLNLTALL